MGTIKEGIIRDALDIAVMRLMHGQSFAGVGDNLIRIETILGELGYELVPIGVATRPTDQLSSGHDWLTIEGRNWPEKQGQKNYLIRREKTKKEQKMTTKTDTKTDKTIKNAGANAINELKDAAAASLKRRGATRANQHLIKALVDGAPAAVKEQLMTPLAQQLLPFLIPTMANIAIDMIEADDEIKEEAREIVRGALQGAWDPIAERGFDLFLPLGEEVIAMAKERVKKTPTG